MLIHVAQNGKKFELDCQASTSVDVVQKALATLMGVPPAEQMLICADLRLESSRNLGHYGLPAEDKHVFLFNRSSLVADAPPPEAELVDDVALELPPEPSRLEIGHPLDESPNPLLRALPSYERQFRHHYQKAQAIWRGSQKRYDLCRQLFAEMEVQSMAIQTARGNMDIYYNHMKQRYDDFTRSSQDQRRKHSDILANFERDMERLRATDLHPVLKTESRSTLLDCLNDQGIRKWAADCDQSHTHFEAKVGELRAQFTGLQRNVEDLKMTEPDVDLDHIEDQMEEHQMAVDEQASILQSLSKDLNTVKKLVEECVSGQLTSSLRPLDAVAALDPMSEVHINSHLPTVEHCDARLSVLVRHMNNCKVAMTRCVHTQLQSVAALQRRIRDMRNQLVGYREAMQRQEEVFAELLLVRKVASSYRACLAEVVRRKAYAELYMHKAGQLAERMARDRDAEVARREEFMRQQGLLPREILEGMGLSGVPSQCEVNVPAFDSSLLEVDVADLQNLAQIGGVGQSGMSQQMGGVVQEERPKSRLGGASRQLSASMRQLSASMSGSAAMITSTMVGSQKAGSFEGADVRGDVSIMTGVERREAVAEGANYDMELENAWLRSEYAAAVAMLCTLEEEDADGGVEEAGGSAPRRREAAAKVSEALKRKDEHAAFLADSLSKQRQQIEAYEQRIREVESQLAEQHKKAQGLGGLGQGLGEGLGEVLGDGLRQLAAGTGDSGVTAEGGGEMGGEEVTSPGKGKGEESSGTGARPAGLDQTMVDATLGETRMLESGMGSVVRDMEEGGVSAIQDTAVRREGGEKASETKALHDVADTARQRGSQQPVSSRADSNLHRELHQLQEALAHRTAACVDAEGRMQALTAEVADLNSQLKRNADLLSECQANCAHLENHLHEARETAQTSLVTADRRGKEYDALRAKSVRMHGLMERLNRCLAAPTEAFPEALGNLAASLSNSGIGAERRPEEEEQFAGLVRQLAEQVGQLVQQRSELLGRIQHTEDAKARLVKQVEAASEKLRSLAVKHERAVQIGKEKICFTSFNVHELAVFLPNAVGHYEAVNCNCPFYFLAEESVLLFRHHQPETAHKFIVGQIVHIDHNVTRPPSPESLAGGLIEGKNEGGGRGPTWNPFGLPLGTDYFVVTVAMVPDLTTSPHWTISS